MSPKVSPETVHARSLRLRELGEHKSAAFRERLAGTTQKALVLKERATDGRLVGLTGNYMEVLIDGGDDLVNRFTQVRLVHALPDRRWDAHLVGAEVTVV